MQRQYPMLWVQYKGRGVEWYSGELPNMIDWMRNKRRAFPLHQVGNAGLGNPLDGNEYCSMRDGDNHFYWLSASGHHPELPEHDRGLEERGRTPAKMSGRRSIPHSPTKFS